MQRSRIGEFIGHLVFRKFLWWKMDNTLVLFDRYYNKQIRILCYASFILRVHGNTFEHPSWFYSQSAPFLFFGIISQHLIWGRLLTSQGFCIAFYRHYFRRKNFLTIIPPEPSYNTSISLEHNVCYVLWHLLGSSSSLNKARFKLRPITFHQYSLPRSEDRKSLW